MRYLSDEWLQEADEVLRGLPALADQVVVGFVVTGGPEGQRRYSLQLGADRAAVVDGIDEAGVTLRLHWDLATQIARGEANAQRAFLDGELMLGGDIGLLLGHQRELAAIEDRFGELRRRTEY